MKEWHVSASLLLLAVAACTSGGDNGTPPTNEAPVLTFTTTAIAVPVSSLPNLTVTATDVDGDPLTITWQITRGTLTAQNAARTTMRWSVPSTVGVDTVTVRVTDGSYTRSVTAEIKVGTLIATTLAPTTFAKANSPYILRPGDANPTVIIPGGTQCTIEPGTELLIDTEAAYISVLGQLTAHGTEDEPIVIRPNNRTFNCGSDRGWWEGIRTATEFGSDGFVDFEHVDIWYARLGVRVFDNARAVLRDCRIRCSKDAGVMMEGNATVSVLDTRVSDSASDGIAIAAITSLPDSVRIEGCTIAFNGSTGIRMDLNDGSQAVPIIVEFNTIEFNGTHGISLAHSVFPSIHYNAFRGNGDNTVSNLFLTGGYPGVPFPVLDATCNFWGSTTSNAIKLTIRDMEDTPIVDTTVDVDPWLNQNPITTPPSCP